MELEFGEGWVKHSEGLLAMDRPVLEARQIDDQILVIYDYMAFPKGDPARNLFAYKANGACSWRADDIGQGHIDAYTGVLSERPLVVSNVSGFACTLELASGRLVSKVFTK